MTCYRISHGNESIAIVTSLGMARAITRGQSPGYYRVCELQVNPPVAVGQAAVRRRAIRHCDGRKPGIQSGRKIEQ